jgi:hypothetical protein
VAGGAVDLPSSASSSSRLKGRSKGQYSPPLSPDLGAQLPSLPPGDMPADGLLAGVQDRVPALLQVRLRRPNLHIHLRR